MRYFVTIRGRVLEVELSADGVQVDGQPAIVGLVEVDGTPIRHLLVDGRSRRLLVHRDGSGEWRIHVGGRELRAEVVDERTRAIREMAGPVARSGGPGAVRAPMPGLVVKVEVEEGQEVSAGQGVIVVEAMKMENELRTEVPGIVTRIHVVPGQPVEKNQVLVELVTPEGPRGD
ncbi:MAG: biotin/lipoyl-binding protein [Gemmatimonadetes bacterium]|nr:biotin/lipoyl-binding protein [Gemmatimonadota bacterium]